MTQYWDLVEPDSPASTMPAGTSSESESQIAAMLDECVRMQLVSDVPVGVFLSGGIDSSSLVAILNRTGLSLSTFSIVFREADYSEAEVFPHHRQAISHGSSRNHGFPVRPVRRNRSCDSAMDQPTIDGINTYFVSERTRAAG